jgi:hypothetical protein
VNDYLEQVERILADAHGESDSDVALLEEAARLADRHGDVPLGLEVRLQLINAANFSGKHELVLVAFTWCLAQLDRDEQLRIDWERNVLWYYKWVINSLSEYSQVSRQQLERSFADMEDRYKRAGFGMGAIYNCKAYTSIRLGDMDAHREARALWRKSPNDEISDCRACQTDVAVAYDLEVGELEKAVKTAHPIIMGRQQCAEIPCLTHGRLLLPLLKLGSADLAEQLHRATLKQALSTREFIATAGHHCAYLALTGKLPRALKVFETGMAGTMTMKRPWDRMIFLQRAEVLFEILAQSQDKPMKIKVPKSVPFYREDQTYSPSMVARALNEMGSGLAADFDRRNGNNYMQQRHQRFREMVAAISAK